MANKDLDLDLFDTEIKSARKPVSRRRRDLIDDDNLDSILDSTIIATNKSVNFNQTRRDSKTREDILNESPRNVLPSKNQPKGVNSWGENNENLNQNPPTARTRRRDMGASFDFNPEETQNTSRKMNQRELEKTEEIEIPEIPDLEDTVEPNEDMAFKVAEAPDVQVHQISTYKELDKEFFREKAFQFLEGNIDVSLLHCGLSTEQQIAEEEDVIWEWNKLFTEVVSILSVNKETTFDQELNLLQQDTGFETTRNKSNNSLLNQTKKEIDF